MKAYEQVKNGSGVLERGIIEMYVADKSEAAVNAVEKLMKAAGYKSTDYMEEYKGNFEISFIIDRCQKEDFMAEFKKAKKAA